METTAQILANTLVERLSLSFDGIEPARDANDVGALKYSVRLGTDYIGPYSEGWGSASHRFSKASPKERYEVIKARQWDGTGVKLSDPLLFSSRAIDFVRARWNVCTAIGKALPPPIREVARCLAVEIASITGCNDWLEWLDQSGLGFPDNAKMARRHRDGFASLQRMRAMIESSLGAVDAARAIEALCEEEQES